MARRRSDPELIDLTPPVDAGSAVAAALAEDLPPADAAPNGRIGDIVWYYRQSDTGARTPVPAMLHSVGLVSGKWNLCLFALAGAPQPRHDVGYSDEPTPGCWTWRK